MGCDRTRFWLLTNMAKFQSTHPHGVRRYGKTQPRKGVVSIHAPAWGATDLTIKEQMMAHWFQSTHPHGVRLDLYGRNLISENVSIHAPAWGATLACVTVRLSPLGFNPRTRMGCDFVCFGCRDISDSFNPRTRMGCDLLHPSFLGDCLLFQSTHPHGVRQKPGKPNTVCKQFQSTHPHGVRRP